MTFCSRLVGFVVVVGFALVSGCGLPHAGGSGSGGGAGGGDGGGAGGGGGQSSANGWTLSYNSSNSNSAVLSATFTPHQGSGTVESIPASDDPWRAHLTDRTFTLSRSNGDATINSTLSLSIGDPTVTIHLTGSASSGGTIVGGTLGGIEDATWCYHPSSTGHQNVRFTVAMNGTSTVSGDNALATFETDNVGQNCTNMKNISLGTPGANATCTQSTIDVLVDSDGNACLDGSVDEPQFWGSAGGGDAAYAGGGSASVDVTWTITAQPL